MIRIPCCGASSHGIRQEYDMSGHLSRVLCEVVVYHNHMTGYEAGLAISDKETASELHALQLAAYFKNVLLIGHSLTESARHILTGNYVIMSVRGNRVLGSLFGRCPASHADYQAILSIHKEIDLRSHFISPRQFTN